MSSRTTIIVRVIAAIMMMEERLPLKFLNGIFNSVITQNSSKQDTVFLRMLSSLRHCSNMPAVAFFLHAVWGMSILHYDLLIKPSEGESKCKVRYLQAPGSHLSQVQRPSSLSLGPHSP